MTPTTTLRYTIGLSLVLLLHGGAAFAQPANAVTGKLKHAGLTEHLGDYIAKDAVLLDEDGKPLQSGDLFDGERPVLLNFVYHTCPMLCSFVLEATAKAAREMDWLPGKEYQIVSISISDADTPESATRQKAKYLERLGRPEAAAGWHFLTGDADQVARVAESAGFAYEKDEETGQYGHPATIIILSPDGRISRYFYGINYDPFDVRASLVEASEGKVGNVVDRLIMYCFLYDPAEGAYVPQAWLAMRLAGGLTVILLIAGLGMLWIKERRSNTTTAKSEESQVA